MSPIRFFALLCLPFFLLWAVVFGFLGAVGGFVDAVARVLRGWYLDLWYGV